MLNDILKTKFCAHKWPSLCTKVVDFVDQIEISRNRSWNHHGQRAVVHDVQQKYFLQGKGLTKLSKFSTTSYEIIEKVI